MRPYLRDMINKYKAHAEWKIQSIMGINLISSINNDEFRIMYTRSNNAKIMMGTETDDIINEIFESF